MRGRGRGRVKAGAGVRTGEEGRGGKGMWTGLLARVTARVLLLSCQGVGGSCLAERSGVRRDAADGLSCGLSGVLLLSLFQFLLFFLFFSLSFAAFASAGRPCVSREVYVREQCPDS